MRCNQVESHLPELVDRPSALSAELIAAAAHVESCPLCSNRLDEMNRVRQSLRRMPGKQLPAQLGASLKVLASRERARLLHADISWLDRVKLAVESSMRPVALPAVGGVMCSVMLFSMFMPALAIPVDSIARGRDVPTTLSTGASVSFVRYPASFPLGDSDLVIDLTVDEQGHMVDYAVVEGGQVLQNPAFRRQFENSLLFTEFTPGTKFGGAAISKIRLLIQTSYVTVEG